jgi:YHS domain-containing protein
VPAIALTPAAIDKQLVNVDERGVALRHHDAVGYVNDQAVVEGRSTFVSTHGGATYWFASAAHKASFDADPATFVPRFGGYCAFAAAQNRLSDVDPDQYEIQAGHLLLFASASFHAQFDKDPSANLIAADENWPGLVAAHGK